MGVIPLSVGTGLLPDGTQNGGARFMIEQALSAGGFGITYKCRDLQFEDLCVVKELALGEIVGRDTTSGTLVPISGRERDVAYWVDKVVREARLLNRIRHEGVVTVRAAWAERGTAFYAMDFVEGEELIARPRAGWDWAVWSSVITKLYDALDAIHATGLVHSDIKPSNILVRPTGQPVLIDFGTARTSEDLRKTHLTSVAFTPGYAAPELEIKERAGEVGAWSDLYSMGMTVMGLFITHPGLDGHPVEARMRETLLRHAASADLYGKDLERSLVAAGVPHAWASALIACVAVEPKQRPQSVAALRALVGDGGVVRTATSSSPYSSVDSSAVATNEPAYDPFIRGPLSAEVGPEFAPEFAPESASAPSFDRPAPQPLIPSIQALTPEEREVYLASSATVGRRLLAGGLDLLLVGACAAIYASDAPDAASMGSMLLFGLLVMNGVTLARSAQTLGQLFVGLVLLRVDDGSRAGTFLSIARAVFPFCILWLPYYAGLVLLAASLLPLLRRPGLSLIDDAVGTLVADQRRAKLQLALGG